MNLASEIRCIRTIALVQKPNQLSSVKRYRNAVPQPPRPFWLPASNYYILAAAITIAVFFLTWGLLHDGGEDVPWVTAGLTSSVVLAGAVLLREVILRTARNRFLETQRRLDRSLKSVALPDANPQRPDKLTLEKNATIIREIQQKSEAARVLGQLSDGHKEVYEMCGRYLAINSRELVNVGAGSPRLASLLRGKEIAEEFHRFHLLRWAEIEARTLSNEAKVRTKVAEKIEAAQKALTVVESARKFYPEEARLKESGDALTEFVASIKVANWVEKAERAAFKGNYKQARKLYNEALFYLGGERIRTESRELAISRINEEIEKISKLES